MPRLDIFDLDEWSRALDLSDMRDLWRCVCSDSPVSIVAIEHYRRLAQRNDALHGGIPVDRLVFGKGEPELRHATKVNGVPYRPADVPWPVDCEGMSMTFLAQFCFAESKDHMKEIPGEVLVVFMRTMNSLLGSFGPLVDPFEDINSLVFEWYDLGLENLVRWDQLPEARVLFPTCFGMRHRSVDYAQEEKVQQQFADIVPDSILPQHTLSRRATLQALCCHPGMKIGGYPFWFKSQDAQDAKVEGQFVASLWGVNPVFEMPYPWVNDPQPLSLNASTRNDNLLLFRDGCCINLFLRNDGTVDWTAEFA